jgi:transposase-like protein
VQEIIGAASHLCIILPKFHCELNFIEFYWGAVKKYLCNNCEYTFDTLKENMLKALKSAQLQTIWQWEHQMYRWMDAYRGGMGTTDAQKQVKQFSSKKYKSHRRILENVTCTFDG